MAGSAHRDIKAAMEAVKAVGAAAPAATQARADPSGAPARRTAVGSGSAAGCGLSAHAGTPPRTPPSRTASGGGYGPSSTPLRAPPPPRPRADSASDSFQGSCSAAAASTRGSVQRSSSLSCRHALPPARAASPLSHDSSAGSPLREPTTADAVARSRSGSR
uniref:Uncharacterized protein n=1 Tax=Chlamydomonas euryale TaxID=1486919 RepID=A0A7R9YUU1_9CHLO|eukprot:358216-Chlamydomonas_euryale.AAC.5